MAPASGCGNGHCIGLADRTGLAITVCHLPPGTSKWNKIEHRLFSYISTNWRGQPLVSLAVIVNLIGATRTAAACACGASSTAAPTRKAKTITDAQMATLHASHLTASMATGTTPSTRAAVDGNFVHRLS